MTANKKKREIPTANLKAALAKTKAKKSMAPGSDGSTTTPAATTTKTPSEPSPKRVRLTDDQRAEREQNKATERAQAKAAREQLRAEKKAAKEAERANKRPHLAKVEKAAKNLPVLASRAVSFVEEIMNKFNESDVTAIIAHLGHQLRVKATSAASTVQLEENQMVRIVSADGAASRWIGHLAHVVKAQRIRCYVKPVGTDKEVYLYSSNVQPLSNDEIKAIGQAATHSIHPPAAKSA
jgi:hypothetical protein